MSTYKPTGQLLLPVHRNNDARFANFYGDRNSRGKFMAQQFIEEVQDTVLVVSGEPGCGKSHILGAAILHAEDLGIMPVAYFSMNELKDLSYDDEDIQSLFESFEGYKVLALDDVDLWLEDQAVRRQFKEVCLFNLFNFFKDHHHSLIVSLRNSVQASNFVLPDLLSRLKSGLLVTLATYSDDEKALILTRLAEDKGFSLGEGVSAYILKRSGREMTSLIELLNLLDQASLTEQRKLTIPFVKKILNW